MTSLRRVREDLKALRDEMTTDGRPRIVWVSHGAGVSHVDAVDRTLGERGLTGNEPGLMLISWLTPGQGGAEEPRAIR